MKNFQSGYSTVLEETYCTNPRDCENADVLLIGSGIALTAAGYLLEKARKLLHRVPQIVVVDAGPADVMTHFAHTRFPRQPFLKSGPLERLGGRLSMWGVSIPRPPVEALQHWPYDHDDLLRRFESAERTMGGWDTTPGSGNVIERDLLRTLRYSFPNRAIRVAPLAINRDGRRWCPLDDVPEMVTRGLRIVSRFRVTRLERNGDRVAAVHGIWQGDESRICTLRPKVVVLAVGVEPLLPLLRPIFPRGLELQAADHIRIDAHGSLPDHHFGAHHPEKLGIGVLLMEYLSSSGLAPAHFEIKLAPRSLWRRGFMQSSDNLRGNADTDNLDLQIQCVSSMHDRLPAADLLNVGDSLPPVMSSRDVTLHGELCNVMNSIAASIGLTNPMFCLRPLLTNHHCYGALRVGRSITERFRMNELQNVYVLPPSAYVDRDDDANPTLKSVVLSTYAMDDIVDQQLNCGCHLMSQPNGVV